MVWQLKRSTFGVAAVILTTLTLPQKVFGQAFTVELPLAVTETNMCNAEAVPIQGAIKITIQQNFDNATGSHFDEHFVSKGKGVGAITMANYTYSEETQNSVQIPGPPLTVAQELVINHMLVAGGTVPNFYFAVRLHLTLNASGVPTANIVEFSTRCQ